MSTEVRVQVRGDFSNWVSRVRRYARPLAFSFVFRASCYAFMAWLALWAEARPAPGPLPDLVLSHVPYLAWVDRHNYVLWLVAYMPVACWLFVVDTPRFIRYMVSSGFLALLRGVCIVATGLGPVSGADLHAGMPDDLRWAAFATIINPFGFFNPDGGARVSLTKDLFFSGHTSTTFLLLLYVWPFRRMRWVMLAAHVLVVFSVFFSHLHYTIDVIGAYAVTLSLYSVRERNERRLAPSSVPAAE